VKDIREIREHVAVFGGGGMSEKQLLTSVFGEERAQKLLSGLTDIRYLLIASEHELVQWGVTPKQAHQFRMIVELVLHLLLRVNCQDRPRISSPEEAYLFLKLLMARHPYQEQFWVVMLDAKMRVMCAKCVALGTLDAATTSPREVFRPAIQHCAASIITAHNHPSGDPTPSPQDITMAKHITQIGELLKIAHLDHLVIGDNDFRSLRHMGHI
jgi:DNA repair protein RadC